MGSALLITHYINPNMAMLGVMRIWATVLVSSCLAFAQTGGPEQLFREAVAAQQRGDDATAIRKYEELLRIRPEVMEARANLGATLVRQGRFDEAIEQYRAALVRDEKNFALRLNLSLAYYKKSAFADAAKQLETLHAAEPENLRVVTLLGDCYAQQGQDEKVVAILRPVATAHPDDLGMAWLLGGALIRIGDRREGLEHVERVAKAGNNAEAYLLSGQTALKMNEFERARDDADAALRLNPQLPGALTLRGMVLPYLGDDEGAIAALRKALEANADDFDAHLSLGAVLHTQRKLDDADQHLRRALELRPDSNLARYEVARLERTEGKLEAAVADFEKVVQSDPRWPQPHIELSALYFRLNRPQDGERERAIFDKISSQSKL